MKITTLSVFVAVFMVSFDVIVHRTLVSAQNDVGASNIWLYFEFSLLHAPYLWRLTALLYWLLGPKNQSFSIKSRKTQPIRTKFGIGGHVKGWQRSGNFGRDWPILGKMGSGTSPAEREFFAWWSRGPFGNFATANFHQIWSWNVHRCPVEEFGNTFWKIFTLGIICPQNLKSKVGQTGISLRAGYRSRDALQRDTSLFTPRCSPRTREFQWYGHLFSTTYGCGATERQSFPIFGFWPIFPIQNT